jgi:hypothetical protein
VGNITIDFRGVNNGTYQFGPCYDKDNNDYDILLYINISENQFR